jgi:plastocyanin
MRTCEMNDTVRANRFAHRTVEMSMRLFSTRTAAVVLSGAGLALGLSACGGSSSPKSSAPPASSATITIASFAFSPNPITVSPGAKVSVNNQDSVIHTVTDGNVFDSSDVNGGGTGSFTAPTKPGTYNFICTIHPQMHGKLVVK